MTITATEALTLRGTSPDCRLATTIGAVAQGTETRAGNAGSIMLNAPTVTLSEGAQLSSSTLGPERGGNVTITATEALTVRGTSPDRRLPTAIAAQAQGTQTRAGNAGSIVVEAPTVTLREGARISSATLGSGRGGNVTITATEALTMRGTSSDSRLPTSITALAGGTGAGAGNAGAIVVEAPTVTLREGARIGSSTFGPGRGGNVTITATNTVTISGPGSGLTTASGGSGKGGDIMVHVRAIELTDGAVISARNAGTADAGEIPITAIDTFLSTNSAITTAAEAAGGGNVAIEARLIRLTDSVLTAEAQGRAQQGSDGGNVTIRADFVILDHSQVQANAFGGNGGNIVFAVEEAFLADTQTCADQACLDASSQLGVAGTIAVNTPTADLSGVVPPLPQTFTPAAVLLRQRCAERLREGEISSFILAGRDGVPLEPDGLLPDPLAQAPPSDEALANVGLLYRGQSGRSQSRGWPGHEFASMVWDAACGSWLEERETLSLPAH